ncbi:Uncharacterised protein [Mycobacteroides abscessus subsp. abscessus]|uniref:hypothetical protein n=1 Tax=Mycobacteroides abscessus TaxID=36809 RepID=UPI000927EBE5|nr:hypothetical protein [Mycobacteroides abscessus]SHU67989.1 Uncharacterised protein [Mycobacteroides abscessus subsp. abscessus]
MAAIPGANRKKHVGAYEVGGELHAKACDGRWPLLDILKEINQRFDDHPAAMVLARQTLKDQDQTGEQTPVENSGWAMVFAAIDRDYTLRAGVKDLNPAPDAGDWLALVAAVAQQRITARTRTVLDNHLKSIASAGQSDMHAPEQPHRRGPKSPPAPKDNEARRL